MAKHEKAGGGRKAQLEARLGTLETRLQTLETAIGSEVERVHLAADQMESAVRALDERSATAIDLSPVHEHLEVLAQGLDVLATRPETVVDLTPLLDRLDLVAAGIADLAARSRDDQALTASLHALPELIDAMRVSADEGQQRLEVLSARTGATASRLDDVLAGLALAVEQIEASAAAQRQGIAAVLAQIDTPPLDALRAEGLAALRADISAAPLAPRPTAEGGNGAEVVARLEGRIDVEFDDVARQLDALGTLLQQTIEAIDRVESQITGTRPETDHMRSVARGTIETLRETSRQRIARRTAPPELNR